MVVDRVDVLLNVSDVERAMAFYRDLIGMTLDASWADEEGRTRWAKLVGQGGSSMMLNEPSADTLTDRFTRPAYGDVVVYLGIENVDELHALRGRLLEAGFWPGECHDEMYGQREFIVRDPDGYEIALATPLHESSA